MDVSDHVEDYAKELVGNWRKFESFVWHDRPEDSEHWAIIYTHHRDSGLMAESNAKVMEQELEPFCDGEDPDCVAEHHGHWGVGWIDGYSIRVYDSKGNITPAFQKYAELLLVLEECPVLDDSDYYEREYESTLENIRFEGGYFVSDDAPDDWVEQVWRWLWDNNQGALESDDDQGGYPDEKSLKAALKGLGMLDKEHED